MNKLASQMLEKAQEFIEENPGLITGLAATGGLGALGGAVFTNVDEDDSAGEKFKKRLKNALLTGGLAAGAFGAGSYGLNKLNNALPEDDVSPLSAAVHSYPVRTLGAVGGVGTGIAIQNKASKDAIADVFGDKAMSKSKLTEVLSNPAEKRHEKAMKKIHDVWGKDTDALKDWVAKTGVDPTSIKPEFTSLADDTARAERMLNKNTAVKGIADKLKFTPERLAKLIAKTKKNKYAIGAGTLGLLLPEMLSGVGSAVGSMFGTSLHE